MPLQNSQLLQTLRCVDPDPRVPSRRRKDLAIASDLQVLLAGMSRLRRIQGLAFNGRSQGLCYDWDGMFCYDGVGGRGEEEVSCG